METANQHCQRGGTNPLDELPEREPVTEYFFGKWVTVGEMRESLQKCLEPCRAEIRIDEHIDGTVYFSLPFANKSEE